MYSFAPTAGIARAANPCASLQCPPSRPNKQYFNGSCYCTDAVAGGGVERLVNRSRPLPFPYEVGTSMLTPAAGRVGLRGLDGTLSTLINVAVIGLAIYGGYTLVTKR